MNYLSCLRLALAALVLLLPNFAHSIGAAGDTEWPEGAVLQVELKLAATLDSDGQPKVTGDLIITNPTNVALTIQAPTNRLVLAFVLSNELGNPVAPELVGKTDPDFVTRSLAPHAAYIHHFQSLNFVTGSAEQSYKLVPGKRYRVIAVYRAAGPHGPGFTTGETALAIPK